MKWHIANLVLCTSNPGKRAEMAAMLQKTGSTVLNLKDLHLPELEVAETGTTYEENALLKARAYAQAYGAQVAAQLEGGVAFIAEDSGLEVDALPGMLGITSARWYVPDMQGAEGDKMRNAALLMQMSAIQNNQRGGEYVCCIVVVDTQGEPICTAWGNLKVVIPFQSRGENGFGYDSVTCPVINGETDRRTLAGYSAEEKNAISHRNAAIKNLLHQLNNT